MWRTIVTGSACVPELIKDGIGCMRKRCLSCVGSALVLLQCHIALSDGASLGWCSEAYGIEWRTGHGDIFGRLPLLYGTAAGAAAFLIRRSSPLMFAGSLAGDGLLNAVRVYLAFGAAEQAAKQDAVALAKALSRLASKPDVERYRVVAHSLGCRLVMEALPLLPPEQRPVEVHLCAAAMTAPHAKPALPMLCQPGGHLYHHFSTGDEALSGAFLLASRGVPALGSAPLPDDALPCDSLASTTTWSSHDASAYLGLLSHSRFRAHFHRLAEDAVRGKEPPERQPRLVEQQQQVAEVITAGLKRLPPVDAADLRTWLKRLPTLEAVDPRRWLTRSRSTDR